MAKEGMIRMSTKEVKRVGIIQQVIERGLTQVKAAEILEITERQVRRLVKKVKRGGVFGLTHKSRGKPGHRRNEKKEEILKVYAKSYSDFSPTFASEKLWERDKLWVNHETLRGWLLEDGAEHDWQRKERPHRKWRERKECFGEMVQMDGSHHNWLEGRGPELVLMGYVDDATGRKYGRFYLYEGTVPALDSFKGYVDKYGVPASVYLDRHSTYKTTRKATIFEELKDGKSLTQFERAMRELGVDVIHAHSAPAKGRVENMFKTFQDRLVKEMRLADIKTLEAANKFLEKYLTKYNKRFSKPAKNASDLHRKRSSNRVLESILCTKEDRSLHKDSTVHYNKRVFLVTERITRRAKKVKVEERLDGSIRIKYKNGYLTYKEIEPSIKVKQEEVVCKTTNIKAKKKGSSIPVKDHPWRNFNYGRYKDSCNYKHLEEQKELVNA